jgi:hypothetical protein
MRGISIFLLVIITLNGFSKTPVDSIDLSRIPQRKIRNYIRHERENKIHYLNDFKPSCRAEEESAGFSMMENTYLIKEKVENVWRTYCTTSLAQAWENRMASFGLLFSRWTDSIEYRNDSQASGIDTGLVFFIDLKLLRGIYNIPVGVEILKIDSLFRTITFSYLEGGRAKGIQTIRLLEDQNGFTKIIHTSAFKSNSQLRDQHLYPFYHTRILNEFHRKMLHHFIHNRDEFIIEP